MKRFSNTRKKRNPRIEIIPMVDVMFLLLVFYVLSSLALSQNKSIGVSLPTASTGSATQTVQPITVTINAQGEVFLQQDPVATEQLQSKLSLLAQKYPGGLETLKKDGVILNTDKSTQMKHTVAVMDQLRLSGIDNFSIATQEGVRP